MKKTFVLIILMLFLCSCKDSKIEIDSNQTDENIIYNEKIFNMLEYLSYSNYDFEYDIIIYDSHFIYDGSKYDNVIKGTFTNNNQKTNFFKSKNKFYDEKNNKEINNVFTYVNMFNIDLNYLKEKVNDKNFECTLNYNQYNCQSGKVIFNFANNKIYSILIKDDNSTYNLSFKNINEVSKIVDKYDSFERFNIDYKISEDEKIINNIKFYKITDVKFTINGNEFNFEDNINEILKLAIYKVQIPNNIIKYVYEKDLIVLETKDTVYCLNDRYLNEILEKILRTD